MNEYNIFFTNAINLNSFELLSFIILTLILAFAIDIVFGELPARIHPVVIIGSVIKYFKNVYISIENRFSSFLLFASTAIVVCIITFFIYYMFSFNVLLLFIIFTVLLSSSFSVNMLLQTAIDVRNDFNESIDKARLSVSYLVSRNTDELTESFIVSAVIESLTENITDSYIAPIFYYFIIGLIIMIKPFNHDLFILLLVPMVYRMVNTLDAMVGYKTDELKNIGYMSAVTDDILNYVPSRIAGIYVVISAYLLNLDGKNAFRIMKRDARNCPSPNSGYTMATAAGALNIQLIKKETYILGDNNKDITVDDITRAVDLSRLTIILFSLTVILLFILIYVIL